MPLNLPNLNDPVTNGTLAQQRARLVKRAGSDEFEPVDQFCAVSGCGFPLVLRDPDMARSIYGEGRPDMPPREYVCGFDPTHSIAADVAAEATSATAVEVTWTDPPAGVDTVAVERYSAGAWATLDADAESPYTDATAAAETTYRYRVRSTPGGVVSATVQVTTPAP
jgi:hypothetical protein